MLHVGPANVEKAGDEADLGVFVDRLAASGADRPTAAARRQIRQVIANGQAPPGLRRLAESLAASVSEPPPPRRPSEDAASVVAAMRVHGLLVLEDFDSAAVAEAVSALLGDGLRVVVAGSTVAELADVRQSLPAEVLTRVVDQLPALSAGEIRELRTLLATSTPARRARTGQSVPAPGVLPAPDDVAWLCQRADRHDRSGAGAGGMVPALLADLDEDRLHAVTSVATCVNRSLDEMPRQGECAWAWALLSDLIYGRHRPVFDRMREDTALSVAALDRTRTAPSVQVTAPLPPGSADAVRRYGEFLRGGGRSRPYFRTPVQRDVAPVLRMLRVGGRVPETEDDIQRVLDHLELGERLARIDTSCAEIGLAAPRTEAELNELADGLVRVAAAARSVGALRHDVLFLGTDSPLSVPDVDAAQQVATAILQYAEHGPVAEAGGMLDRMADELAGRCAAGAAAPEHELAVAALRARDVEVYVTALDALVGARREAQDEARRAELLGRLGASAPHLAAAWAAHGERAPAALGLAWFTPIDGLLSAVPEADTVDVVLVLGAARLGVERLLLSAAAPRMIAVVGPGERSEGAPNLLSVLHRASALIIRGRAAAAAPVVPIAAPRKVPAPMGQAGA